jgi:hypothetical protein
MPLRRGWNRAATRSVDAATASWDSRVNDWRATWNRAIVHVRQRQGRGQHTVDERPVDKQVDVVEAVPEDRDTDGNRQKEGG